MYIHAVGLSSHTATLLANGDVLLIGREGSLRMQRRSGQAYLLRGDLKSGAPFTLFPLHTFYANVASKI